MKILLDTNVCIAAMRNHPLVVQKLSSMTPGDCAISTISAYELFSGVEKCDDPGRERPKVERLLSVVGLLPFDLVAVAEAARIRAVLEAAGQLIGTQRNSHALPGCPLKTGKPRLRGRNSTRGYSFSLAQKFLAAPPSDGDFPGRPASGFCDRPPAS